MRTITVIAAGATLLMAGMAGAQAPGAPYPQPGMGMQRPPLPPAPRAPIASPRWGSQVGGRWWGGANAPGGWGAYRQPYRGYRLPGYWVAPRFHVADWNRYGLYAPTGGYNWVRYYDDAVLVDGAGGVSDWRGGLDWDAYDRSDYAYDARGYDDRRGSDGVGGAVAGAVVGGVAGNVIAGRGNRLGGTLIGAGVGAAAGYGIDRAASRDRRGRDRYRDVPPPPADGHWEWHRDGADYPPPPPPPPHGPANWVSGDGRTTVTTTTSGGYGYAGGAPVIVSGGGYGYAGGVTTISVQSAPVVTTTTTTEIIEDRVTYTRPVVRRVARPRVWRPRPRPRCLCGS